MENLNESAIKHIDSIANFYRQSTDFDNRNSLIGLGFGIAKVCVLHYPVGTAGYNNLYNLLYTQLTEISAKANEGVKMYEVVVLYKTRGELHQHTFNVQERTEQEAIKRAEQKQFYGNGKNPLKVKIINIEITEVNTI